MGAATPCVLSRSATVPRSRFWLLASANFAVALGYGAILPLLPMLLAGFAGVDGSGSVAWHTGGLLGTYMLALFVAAPVWGALFDRIGGSRLFIIGLVGYAAALVAFAAANSVTAAYGWRVLAGVAAGAGLPVVNATIGAVVDRHTRARLFAGASMATLLGLLAGPALSGLISGAMQQMGEAQERPPAVIGLPLAGTAAFALLVAAGFGCRLIGSSAFQTRGERTPAAPARVVWHQARPALYASFLLTLSLGAFEATLPLLGQTALSLDAPAIALLLAVCMLVMLAVQAGLFLTAFLHRVARARLIAAGFLVIAAGVVLLTEANSFAGAAAGVAVIGMGGAFLQPAIAYLATLNDGGASGMLLGALTGAGSLGAALGSFVSGVLFANFEMRGLWVVVAGLIAGAAWIGASAGRSGPWSLRARNGRGDALVHRAIRCAAKGDQ